MKESVLSSLLAPHVLTPHKLEGDAGQEDEDILEEEGNARVGVLRLEGVVDIITDVDILTKQDITSTWTIYIKPTQSSLITDLPMRDPNPIIKPKKNQILPPTEPKQPSEKLSPLSKLLETALTMNMEMVEKTPQI